MKNGSVRLDIRNKWLTEKDVAMIVDCDSNSYVTVAYCTANEIDISTLNPFVRLEHCNFINSRVVTPPGTVNSCAFTGTKVTNAQRSAVATIGYYTPVTKPRF